MRNTLLTDKIVIVDIHHVQLLVHAWHQHKVRISVRNIIVFDYGI